MVEREQLVLPNGAANLLLHSCCAPCSGEVMEALIASNIHFSIFFYPLSYPLPCAASPFWAGPLSVDRHSGVDRLAMVEVITVVNGQ